MSPQTPYILRKQDTKFIQEIEDAIKQPQNSPLLFYAYGIGGIGKSSLIDKLIETFSPRFQCAKISFGINSPINTPIDLMKAFDSQTSGDISDWDVTNFRELSKTYDSTVQRLAYKSVKGDSNQNSKNKKEILSRLGALAKTGMTLWDTFSSGGAATVASKAGGSLLQAGIDKGVDSFVEGAGASMEIADLIKKHKATKDDLELQELVRNPLPKLAKSFVETIIQKSQHQPVILFIDTYEKASSEFDTFLCRFLLSNSELQKAPVRIVMVGRYSLSNPRYQRMFQQPDIRKLEKQLKEFTPKETKSYLAEIGINKPDDIKKFSKATNGYPYYLNLIREQKEDGRDIKLSRGGKEMVERLLDGYSSLEKEVISLASHCRWFDRSIIEYLIEQNKIKEDSEQKRDWFDWLVNRDFTIDESPYRFDDVARDIIRQAKHNDSKKDFANTHRLLFEYFQQLANNTVDPDELVNDKYEDPDWCKYAIESTYHALYADKKQGQIKLLTHFFEGAYLKFPDIAEKSFAIVTSETDIDESNILPGSTKQFLQSISWAIVFGWQFVGLNPNSYNIKVDSNGNFIDIDISKFVKRQIELSISRCLHKENTLLELSRCFALLCKYVRSQPNNLQETILKQSELEIEKAGSKKYKELSIFICINLASILFDKKEYIKALEKFDKVIDLDERTFLAWRNKAITFGEMDQCNEALDCFNKALELDPNDYSTWAERGVILGRMEQDRQALDDFNVSLQISPNNSWVWRNRALALLNLKNPHLALIDCNKAIEINLKDSKAHRNRGIILYAMNKHSEAILSFNKALELDSRDSLSWNDRGMILWRTQKYNEALDNYNKAIIVTPNNSIFLNMKALILSLQGKYNEALNNINQAIEIDPQEILYAANKSIILSRMSNFEEAVHYYETAISSNPEDESGHYAAACYFALQNKAEEASKHLEKAIEIAPLRCQLEAKHNPDFDLLRDNPEFKALIDD